MEGIGTLLNMIMFNDELHELREKEVEDAIEYDDKYTWDGMRESIQAYLRDHSDAWIEEDVRVIDAEFIERKVFNSVAEWFYEYYMHPNMLVLDGIIKNISVFIKRDIFIKFYPHAYDIGQDTDRIEQEQFREMYVIFYDKLAGFNTRNHFIDELKVLFTNVVRTKTSFKYCEGTGRTAETYVCHYKNEIKEYYDKVCNDIVPKNELVLHFILFSVFLFRNNPFVPKNSAKCISGLRDDLHDFLRGNEPLADHALELLNFCIMVYIGLYDEDTNGYWNLVETYGFASIESFLDRFGHYKAMKKNMLRNFIENMLKYPITDDIPIYDSPETFYECYLSKKLDEGVNYTKLRKTDLTKKHKNIEKEFPAYHSNVWRILRDYTGKYYGDLMMDKDIKNRMLYYTGTFICDFLEKELLVENRHNDSREKDESLLYTPFTTIPELLISYITEMKMLMWVGDSFPFYEYLTSEMKQYRDLSLVHVHHDIMQYESKILALINILEEYFIEIFEKIMTERKISICQKFAGFANSKLDRNTLTMKTVNNKRTLSERGEEHYMVINKVTNSKRDEMPLWNEYLQNIKELISMGTDDYAEIMKKIQMIFQ